MNVFKGHKKTYIYLGSLAVFFILYFSLRSNADIANRFCSEVMLPLEQWLGKLCSHVNIPVNEILYALIILVSLFMLVRTVILLIIRKERWKTLYRFTLYLVTLIATFYALFCLFWGMFYHTDSFVDKSGLNADGGTKDQLMKVTAFFIDRTNEYAKLVQRDEDGIYAGSLADIFDVSVDAYASLYDEYPFLEKPAVYPKAFVGSRILSYLDFTGYYFPMTGEANINVDCPAYHIPMTICHELAHQSGITSEKECNFIGILASTRYENDDYRYSGYLCGLSYLINALYKEDSETCKALYARLDENARNDLIYNSEYWVQFEGTVQQLSNTVYDGFLKSNGDANGVKSYGLVTDLLLTYFGQ